MRIWLQIISSPQRYPNFFSALQAHCDSMAAEGTVVEVRGTPSGGYADQYSALLRLDEADILRLAHREFSAESRQMYAMGNTLDPAIDGLREILDVPVVSIMEVSCFLANILGDKFGVIVPNEKFIPRYREVISSYGVLPRLAGISFLPFNRITDMDEIFVDQAAADRALEIVAQEASALGQKGAEVLLVPGPVACLLARTGVRELSGLTVLDMFGALVKVSEGIGALAQQGGVATSRKLKYAQPPRDMIQEVMAPGLK